MTPERRFTPCSSVSVVNFEYVANCRLDSLFQCYEPVTLNVL